MSKYEEHAAGDSVYGNVETLSGLKVSEPYFLAPVIPPKGGKPLSPTGGKQTEKGGQRVRKDSQPSAGAGGPPDVDPSGGSGSGGSGSGGQSGSGPPPTPSGSSEADDWSILKDYLSLSANEVSIVADSQIRQINPSNQDIVRAAIIGKVKKSNFEATVGLIKLLAYEGFSPVVTINSMLENLLAYNAAAPRTKVWKLVINNYEFTVTEQANLSEDVLFLATVFLTRGNNLRKIMMNIDKSVKDALKAKIDAYKIKNDTDDEAVRRKRNEKIELTSKDITLSRIAASFPHITLAVVSKTGVPGKVEMTCIRLKHQLMTNSIEEPPAILTHGLIPSLLPKTGGHDFIELKQFCYFFNIEQSITLQTPNMKKQMMNQPIVTLMESSEKFVNAAVNGPLNEDNMRRVLLNHLKLENPSSPIKSWIAAGAEVYNMAATAGTYSVLVSILSNQLQQRQPEQ